MWISPRENVDHTQAEVKKVIVNNIVVVSISSKRHKVTWHTQTAKQHEKCLNKHKSTIHTTILKKTTS